MSYSKKLFHYVGLLLMVMGVFLIYYSLDYTNHKEIIKNLQNWDMSADDETGHRIKTSPIKRPETRTTDIRVIDQTEENFVLSALYSTGHQITAENVCPHQGRGMKLVIVVTTAIDHFEKRMAVRLTWGHYSQRVDTAIVFCVGVTLNPEETERIQEESATYGDIIQGSFIDTYKNLTLKSVASLEWVQNYCSHVKFILKTDDDMYINVPRLYRFIEAHEDTKRTIFGKLARGWTPNRDKKNKYYVPKTQYKQSKFLDFLTGPAYLLTSDVISELYNQSLHTSFLNLEDVFVTGVVANALNINRLHATEFKNEKVPFQYCIIKKDVISVHDVNFEEQFDLWTKLLDGSVIC